MAGASSTHFINTKDFMLGIGIQHSTESPLRNSVEYGVTESSDAALFFIRQSCVNSTSKRRPPTTTRMDLQHFVVTDEIDDTGESSAFAPVNQQPTRRTSNILNKNEPRILCTHCNVKVVSSTWDAHILTKNHLKKAGLPNPDAYDERDLYVDESTNAYETIIGSKRPLAGGFRNWTGLNKESGAEYVVTEKSSGETLCVLCMAQLKDSLTIIDHLRSQKHINTFITKHYPEIFRAIQRKTKSKEEMQRLLVKSADDLIRDGGKKEPLLHEKGYYKNSGALKQKLIDERLKAREKELNEQKLMKLHEIGVKRSDRLSSRDKPVKRGEKRRRSRSSRSPHSRRHRRSRSRSGSRSPRSSRSRSARRSRSRSRSLRNSRDHGGYENLRDDYRLVGESRSPQQRAPKRRPSPPAAYAVDNRGWQDRERPAFVPSPHGHKESSPVRAEPPVDELEELPTEPDLFEILCNCPLVDLNEGDRTYIQDTLDSLQNEPLIGAYFVAEYADPRGTYEPGYLCSLCQCRLNPSQAVKHIVSERHIMTFMKNFYNKQFTALCIGTLNEEVRSQMKHRYLSEICEQEERPFDSTNDDGEQSHGKPPLYSAATKKAREKAELEKELPPHCEKNLEEGWYSIRRKSADYYRRFAPPDALYYSIRNPDAILTDFYGDWNPMLMRRLQDKFNFKLDHIKWLQRLLTQWQIPVYSPLQKSDLRPLEQEVEAAVLNELVDQLLKPVAPLRHMQVFQYEVYPEKQQKSSEVGSINETRMGSGVSVAPRKPLKVVPKSDKDRTLLAMIDQVLAQVRSQQHTDPNPVLQLLVALEDARAVLFALATKQPTQLHQLVGLVKGTLGSIPPDKLEALRKRLNEVGDEARREQEAADRAAAHARDALLRRRREQIEHTRMELLRAVQRLQDNPATVTNPPPVNVQSFTPKIPGQKGFGFSR